METLSKGHEREIFTDFRLGYINHFSQKLREQVKSKKLKAVYYVAYRSKNTRTHLSDSNTDSLDLAFDTNLSSDFHFEDINFAKGSSFSISLLESNQRDFGRTQLKLSIQYIDEEQNFFENIEYAYCPSIGGTIENRLLEYKKAFDNHVAQSLVDYKMNGFKVNIVHTINNFAGYLYYKNKKASKDEKFISEFAQKSDINKILIIYSIMNGDCFWKHVSPFQSHLNEAPYYDQSNCFTNIQATNLYAEQVFQLNQSINIVKHLGYMAFEKHLSSNGFDYFGFKQEFFVRTKNA